MGTLIIAVLVFWALAICGSISYCVFRGFLFSATMALVGLILSIPLMHLELNIGTLALFISLGSMMGVGVACKLLADDGQPSQKRNNYNYAFDAVIDALPKRLPPIVSKYTLE